MSNSDEQPLIKVEDFDTITLSITIHNLTSKTGFSDGIKIIGDFPQSMDSNFEFEITLTQLLDNGFILDMPKGSCAVNHQLNLELTTGGMAQERTFKFATEVRSVNQLTESRNSVKLEIIDGNDPAEWDAFVDVFSARQEDILEFLKAAKG